MFVFVVVLPCIFLLLPVLLVFVNFRRFPKRILVPMPGIETRYTLLDSLLSKQGSPLRPAEIAEIAR